MCIDLFGRRRSHHRILGSAATFVALTKMVRQFIDGYGLTRQVKLLKSLTDMIRARPKAREGVSLTSLLRQGQSRS